MNIYPEKDIGKEFLGQIRGKRERDTDFEVELLQLLRNYFDNPYPENKEALEPILKELLKIKHLYPNELVPNRKDVYRGTKISNEEYDLMMKFHNQSLHGWLPFRYQPKYGIQSWTIEQETANKFAKKNRKTVHSMVLHAKVDNSFIFTANLTRLISSFKYESEILRVSREPIDCIVRIY